MAALLASATLTSGILLSANPAFATDNTCKSQIAAFSAKMPLNVKADIDALQKATTKPNFAKLKKDLNAMTDREVKVVFDYLWDHSNFGEDWQEWLQGVEDDGANGLLAVAHVIFDSESDGGNGCGTA
jgi:hypothetical protein